MRCTHVPLLDLVKCARLLLHGVVAAQSAGLQHCVSSTASLRKD